MDLALAMIPLILFYIKQYLYLVPASIRLYID